MSSELAGTRAGKIRLLRWTLLLLLSALLALCLIPVGMGFLLSWGVTHPFCYAGSTPEDYGLAYEEISVPSRTGIDFDGYFMAGENGATVIVPPAYGQDRGGWLAEASLLVQAGFTVLTYDSRPCAGLAPHSLGYWEASDILDAVEYLRGRIDVDLTRLGVHGFSQAGASNLFAAAMTTDVRAVVAEGGYVDFGGQTLGVGKRQEIFPTLVAVGAQIGYRISTGLDMSVLTPINRLAAIAPRRVLLVYGSREGTLAEARQAAEAYEHVSLWVVPGASHGTYLASAGESAFRGHVVAFFEDNLLGG